MCLWQLGMATESVPAFMLKNSQTRFAKTCDLMTCLALSLFPKSDSLRYEKAMFHCKDLVSTNVNVNRSQQTAYKKPTVFNGFP